MAANAMHSISNVANSRAFLPSFQSSPNSHKAHLRTLTQRQHTHQHNNTIIASSSNQNTASTTTPKTSKKPTIADLRKKIEHLETENQNLRQALASLQSNNTDDIDIQPSIQLLDYESDGYGIEGASSAAPLSSTMLPTIGDNDNAWNITDTTTASQPPLEQLQSQTSPSSSKNQQSANSPFDKNLLEREIQWPSPSESNPPFYDRPARSSHISVPVDNSSTSFASSLDEELSKLPAPTSSSGQPLHIMHITAEMAPCAKVGGLGDVVTGLSKAAIARGANVEIILPYYECLENMPDAVQNLQYHFDFDCPKGNVRDGIMHLSTLKTHAWTATIENCPVILLRPEWNDGGCNLFRGSRIYGGSYNEAEAYLYFSRAALEYISRSGRKPDILHAHEWQAAAVPMLFWELFANSMANTRPVFTIHNFGSPGECRQDEFAATGLNGELYATIDRALDERTIGHNPERLSLLKGGIIFCSAVTTVSPNYATETLAAGAAGWLQSTLARPDVAQKYFGVLNGIDTEMWNPADDLYLPACYSSLYTHGKALCKKYLQRGLGMNEDPDKPLVAVISRLVPQKGIHLIEHAAARTIEMGGQFVLLGTGHADGGLRGMAANAASNDGDGKGDLKLMFMYSEALAHMIYAAADFFLVPSMYEPCGLTQLIALRYGGVPIVRATGGLVDTVKDIDDKGHVESPAGAPSPNGFVFQGTDAGSLNSALDRALSLYLNDRESFEELSRSNLESGERWSWKAPAESYLQLYRGVLP